MSPPLVVVSDLSEPRLKGADSSGHTLADRVQRLQVEAKGLAREHVAALRDALADVERLAAEIAAGGEAYPAGVRDIARRLAEDSAARARTIATLAGRSWPPRAAVARVLLHDE
jgi:hypothetical protein